MGTAVRPAKPSPGPCCVCRRRRFRERGPEGVGSHGAGWRPAAAIGVQAAAGRSGAAQGGNGDLVCLLLRYAVAGHRTALRYSLQHPLRTVRPQDPDRPWRRLRRTWRRVRGDAPEPSAVVIDSRSCRSVSSCFERGMRIHGVKIQLAVEKYGIPLAIDVALANRHDTKAIVPVLRALADGGVQGPAHGDLGYRGKRPA